MTNFMSDILIPKVSEKQRKSSWLYTVLAVLIMIGVGFFVWRIIYYIHLIQSGEFVTGDSTYFNEFTISEKLAAIPIPEDTEFELLTSDDPFFGAPDAKVKIIEFADFGCVHSRQSSNILRSLSAKYGDQIHYVYRDFPLEEIHPGAQKAAEAGECAQDQGMFWPYHDKIYANQTNLSEERLLQLAQEVGLDLKVFATCLLSGKYAGEVQQDYQEGIEAGVRGTPTFFVNGIRINGAIPEELLDQLIQRIINS